MAFYKKGENMEEFILCRNCESLFNFKYVSIKKIQTQYGKVKTFECPNCKKYVDCNGFVMEREKDEIDTIARN